MRASALIAVLALRLAREGDLEVTYADHMTGDLVPIDEILYTKGSPNATAGMPSVDVFLLKEMN